MSAADLPTLSQDALARLAAVIESRKPANGGDPDKSYVARLFAKGTDAILKKVGEEATETVMAAKDGVAAATKKPISKATAATTRKRPRMSATPR